MTCDACDVPSVTDAVTPVRILHGQRVSIDLTADDKRHHLDRLYRIEDRRLNIAHNEDKILVRDRITV